ncbi:MAG: sulfatase [Deltaproteobacteria bacterium]|nr:sulfatase [Deltaproteobacteria bacterium]
MHALLALLSLAALAHAQKPARPNVILISIDTLAADHMGLYGYPRDTTPFLSKFAAENVLFENTFSQAAYTLPSHISMFTGLYVETHKIYARWPRTTLAPGFKTLPEILKANGYKTIWMATRHDSHLAFDRGLGRGFDEVDDVALEMGPGLAKVKRLLGKVKARPFFLFLHTYMVHDPYRPIAPYDHLFDPGYKRYIELDTQKLFKMSPMVPDTRDPELSWQDHVNLHTRSHYLKQFNLRDEADHRHFVALYDGGVRTADDAMKAIFATLKRQGLYDNSLIVLTSDHGETFGARGYYFHMRPTREEIHVPLIMKLPGVKPRRIAQTALSIDILPTVLDQLRLPAPAGVEGRSLLPLLEGKPIERDEYFHSHGDGRMDAIWNSEWKLRFSSREIPDPLLFHLSDDPYELHDIAGANPSVVNRLKAAMTLFRMKRAGN